MPADDASSVFARALEVYNRRDWDALPDFYVSDVEWIDRRTMPLWGSITGVDALREFFAATIEAIADIQIDSEVLQAKDEALIADVVVRGQAPPSDGGGPMMISWGEIVTFTGDRIQRREIFDDAQAALAEWESRG